MLVAFGGAGRAATVEVGVGVSTAPIVAVGVGKEIGARVAEAMPGKAVGVNDGSASKVGSVSFRPGIATLGVGVWVGIEPRYVALSCV